MSEWVDNFSCPKCGTLNSTPVWDDGECKGCGNPFTFDGSRGKDIRKPTVKDITWGVPGWRYHPDDDRPRPKWAVKPKPYKKGR